MLTLGSNRIEFQHFDIGASRIVMRLSTDPERPIPLRSREGFIVKPDTTSVPDGYRCYLVVGQAPASTTKKIQSSPIAVLPAEFDYLDSGDIVRLSPQRGGLHVLYRRSANTNSFLLTERCNHYCLMCSQPPRNVDDGWIVDEVLETLPLIDRDTREIGFTGGEPTLLGPDLFKILNATKNLLPDTAVHILSNGRRFSDPAFASEYASIGNPRMMIGIPVYSDISSIHDYVVQANGAYDETIRGILNLKRCNQAVEIRVVVHKQTYSRLTKLAEFIARNLTFVDHVAFMGLEITGFTKANLDDLWIDPYEYRYELAAAVRHLDAHNVPVSIYNHQLCTLAGPEVWKFAKKSISDWKNDYLEECVGCSELDACGGLFSFNLELHSRHIRAFVQ